MSRKGKSKRDLKRGKPYRKPRKYILIVVEGKETEYNYFTSLKQDLRLPTTNIKVVSGSGGSPQHVIEKAIHLCEENEKENKRTGQPKYNEVFCIFDGDKIKEHQEAAKIASKYSDPEINSIVSVPCFEFWFLLHYRNTSSPFSKCKQVIEQLETELRREGIESYQKDMNMYERLKFKLNCAMRHAISLEKARRDNEGYINPSTQVHILVKHLQEQKNFE